jgi:hypothetical protein
VRYRKPRTLNWVSFLLVILAGLCVYVGIYLWPVYSARARAKGILYDHVPMFYKANLRDDHYARTMMESVKTSIADELMKAGINDKGAKIMLRRGQKEIELEVRFKAKAHFPFPDKTLEFDLAPKVISDATRVDW